MLAVAHPVQSTDRDRPSLASRTPSATAASRPRGESYRERDRGRDRERERERDRDRDRGRLTPRSKSTSQSPHPTNLQRPRSSLTSSHTRSPTIHPHDQPVHVAISASQSTGSSTLAESRTDGSCLDFNTYPSNDLLRLLATLLQEIASANDRLRSPGSAPAFKPQPTSPSVAPTPAWKNLTSAAQESLATPTSSLTFHARHIPSISLEAYLLRILKYCPTTNQVFLSLLVYFDRMSKLSSDATGKDFIIDSYNIHRLVIAGVTVASKFFSDVFYTNSRYAKVGGLPQPELNQLELQFLLLNDFNLDVPPTEMQRYATLLMAYSRGETTPSSPVEQPPPTLNGFACPFPTAASVNGMLNITVSQAEPSESEEYAETDDTEDETIRPTHSSGPSETSSLATAQSDADDETDDGFDSSIPQ